MTAPIVAFFSLKGGVGTTSLVYNVAWMLAELGKRVVVVDLDPQTALTARALPAERVDELIADPDVRNTVIGWAATSRPTTLSSTLWLVPGDLRLASADDGFTEARVRGIARDAAASVEADYVLLDVGASAGSTTRAALRASDFLATVVRYDRISLQAMRSLGSLLEQWRADAPPDRMQPIGYIVTLRPMRLNEPPSDQPRLMRQIADEYRAHVLGQLPADGEPDELARMPDYTSLVDSAVRAHKPLFALTPADNVVGAHLSLVRLVRNHYRELAERLIDRIARGAA